MRTLGFSTCNTRDKELSSRSLDAPDTLVARALGLVWSGQPHSGPRASLLALFAAVRGCGAQGRDSIKPRACCDTYSETDQHDHLRNHQTPSGRYPDILGR
ncbi:hypothetical protein LIA77_10933 [Sarocladium implicatum]|nr:hypothetical protein LIA77_10933 [Sarocladium implicatum]